MAATWAVLVLPIIDARKQTGLTQKELAEKIGLKQPAISRIDNLSIFPQINTIMKLLGALGYTIKNSAF